MGSSVTRKGANAGGQKGKARGSNNAEAIKYIESLGAEYRMMQLSKRQMRSSSKVEQNDQSVTGAGAGREANKAAAKHAKGSSDEYAKAWEKAVGRIDEAFAGAWKVLLTVSKVLPTQFWTA